MKTLEYAKKVLLIGEGGVGKTSLIRRFVIDRFEDRYIMTVGTKVSRKVLDLDFPERDARLVLSLDIWDVIGQMESERAHAMHFRGAEAFMLVFDGTDRRTFDAVGGWAARARLHCGPVGGLLVCNKWDLKQRFAVTPEEVEAEAQRVGLKVAFTSAKTGQGVEEAFGEVGRQLSRRIFEGLTARAA
jgi:small GTP-binding protein